MKKNRRLISSLCFIGLFVFTLVVFSLNFSKVTSAVQGVICTDSDDGLNYDVAGHVFGTDLQDNPYDNYDQCLSGSNEGYVREWYCGNDNPKSQLHFCTYGCEDSACVSPSCTDSDGGLNYDVKGNVSGYKFSGAYQFYDQCLSGIYKGYIKEYYCDGTKSKPAEPYECPKGCDDGACIAPCTDNDGDDFAVEGDSCGLVDCDDSNPAVNPNATEVCDNGLDDDCDGFADLQDSDCGCTDSDGGKEYYKKGTTTYQSNSETDYCSTGTLLSEFYCEGNDVKSQSYECVKGCGNGACVQEGFTSNMVVIGWDGVQKDHFWQCYNKELNECPDGLPNVKELSGGIIFDSIVTDGATSTKPGWAQLLSGYDAEVMGIYTNGRYQPLPEGYSVFEKIENHFGENDVVTLFLAGKGEHVGGACVGEKFIRGGEVLIEKKGQPWCITKQHVDYFENNMGKNRYVGNKALELLETHKNDRFFAFFLFREPDPEGHIFGENSVEYSEAIIDEDQWLGTIVAKLKELGIYEQTLIYVITDHGFDEDSQKHFNAPYGFMASNDPLVIRSGDRKDVGPTILKRYGISLEADGDIPAVNGYPLDSLSLICCTPEGEAYVDYPGSPQCCNNLKLINLDKYLWGGECTIATGGESNDSGYCTSCGDGQCQEPEDRCNCPEDCS